MLIKPQQSDARSGKTLARELREIIANQGAQSRVCGETCTMICTDCGSMSCQCMCHCECPEAGKRLSSDPEKFPIEAGIIPLVYEMKREGSCVPCWSCEGHERHDGSLWKIPRVWFYCSSMVHLRLVGSGAHAMFIAKKLKAPWQVVITHSDPGNIDTTFSLEPKFNPDSQVGLGDLRADVLALAKGFSGFLKSEAGLLTRSVSQRQNSRV